MHYYIITTSFAALLTLSAGSSSPSATVDAGVLIGTTTLLPSSSTIVNKFLGIPFAAPPKRFSPPQKVKAWSKPLAAKEFKPACVQQFSCTSRIPIPGDHVDCELTREVDPKASHDFVSSVFNTPAAEESEDCLYLNVYAPATPAGGKGRAVMFWIYGGGLQFGHAGHPGYDGSKFAAEEDVIIVSVNYRTNGMCHF